MLSPLGAKNFSFLAMQSTFCEIKDVSIFRKAYLSERDGDEWRRGIGSKHEKRVEAIRTYSVSRFDIRRGLCGLESTC